MNDRFSILLWLLLTAGLVQLGNLSLGGDKLFDLAPRRIGEDDLHRKGNGNRYVKGTSFRSSVYSKSVNRNVDHTKCIRKNCFNHQDSDSEYRKSAEPDQRMRLLRHKLLTFSFENIDPCFIL